MAVFDRRCMLRVLAGVMTAPQAAWAAQGTTAHGAARQAATGLALGPPRPFSYDTLRALAERLAGQPYRPPAPVAGAKTLNFARIQKIRFRQDDALWRGMAGTDPVAFFHLNKYSNLPVQIFSLERGQAREIVYAADLFDYSALGSDFHPVPDMGFAGFRVMDGQNAPTDWLAFQGASYFRSAGQENQYGASARGIAIDTGLSTPEEFPRFSRFWLAPRPDGAIIYALLEGPSITGAYRFDCVRQGAVTMDVRCDLFLRAGVTRLGIAPLTSMYWYGENERAHAADWRPEIHDSDGLAIWNGRGERLWRPLINPPAVQTNSFLDSGPKGFGLLQRDRDFDHYQDDGAFYNKRPSIWVEPKGDWGKGAVQLVEIPTVSETEDNIVAYWKPDAAAVKGARMQFAYRLYWQDHEPFFPAGLARVVATRIGRGGIPGQVPWPTDTRKFVIDFQGGAFDTMRQRFDLTPVISVSYGDGSAGRVEKPYVLKVVGTKRWRAVFDAVLGPRPLNLRCVVQLGDRVLTETWIYQYFD